MKLKSNFIFITHGSLYETFFVTWNVDFIKAYYLYSSVFGYGGAYI
jgi:hypothetical protein